MSKEIDKDDIVDRLCDMEKEEREYYVYSLYTPNVGHEGRLCYPATYRNCKKTGWCRQLGVTFDNVNCKKYLIIKTWRWTEVEKTDEDVEGGSQTDVQSAPSR